MKNKEKFLEDELVDFETATMAHMIHFNLMCEHSFDKYGSETNWTTKHFFCWRPTQTRLNRWMREVHKLHVDISPGDEKNFGVIYGTIGDSEWVRGEDGDPIFFETYELAMEAGLKENLKILKALKVN